MFCKLTQVIIGLYALLSLLSTAVESANIGCLRPCSQQSCFLKEQPIWAMEGDNCYLYANFCLFQRERCQRPKLRQVKQMICQKYCKTACTKIYQPICAEYNGRYEIFGNRCMYDSHVCTTGKVYREVQLAACNLKSSSIH